MSLGFHTSWKFFRKSSLNLTEKNHPVEKLGIRTNVHDRKAAIRNLCIPRCVRLLFFNGQSHRTNIKTFNAEITKEVSQTYAWSKLLYMYLLAVQLTMIINFNHK